MSRFLLLILTAFPLVGCVHLAPPPENFVPMWPHGMTVQGSLGIAELSQDPLAAVVAAGGDETVGTTHLPVMMVAMQHPLAGAYLQPGIEWGGSIGWDEEGKYVDGDYRFEEELVVGDLFVGGCLIAWLEGGTRMYAGAGALWHGAWIEYEYEDTFGEAVREDESGFGTGVYLRGGIELPVWDNTWIGLQVRWIEANLDFGGGIGELDVDTFQILLSATQGL